MTAIKQQSMPNAKKRPTKSGDTADRMGVHASQSSRQGLVARPNPQAHAIEESGLDTARVVGGKSNLQGDWALVFEDPRPAWSPAARAIVDAARALLVEQGYRGISYAQVARAAGVDKGTISYNFGNKAGLVTAVVDSMIHDECLAIYRESRNLSGVDRTRHVVAAISRIVLAADAQRGWFEIYPHAAREEELKIRLRALYAWWFHVNLEWLGVHPVTPESQRIAQGLTGLIAAITDGLAMQIGLGIAVDMDPTLKVLETMVEAALEAVRKAESATG